LLDYAALQLRIVLLHFLFLQILSLLRSFIRQSSFKISSIEFHGHIIHILTSISGA
jgi:hypothetical protein